jgi:hypothetical protein
MADSGAVQALRTGKASLTILPESGGAVTYRFDPDRPDARAARL